MTVPMPGAPDLATPRSARPTRPWQAWLLAGIEVFVAYQAVSGGHGLITDTWQLPVDWLARTPFDSWVGPGWVLIALVGVPHLLAALPILFLPRRPRLGILAGVLADASLLVWIAAQLAILQVYFFLQPVIAVIGVIELALALWWRRRVLS
ncbi:MAG: hypothetical protein AAGC63_10170 [Propionicimonas sp.]